MGGQADELALARATAACQIAAGFAALAVGMSPNATPLSTDPPLAVENLTVTLRRGQGTVPVLREVSFAVAAGEAVAILGEPDSGIGELPLALLGLLPHEARPVVRGVVRLQARPVGMMWQDHALALDPSLRIGRQLAQRARRRRDIPGLLAAAGLDPAATDLLAFPHHLAPELRQRVLLALSLAGAPALLIVQEPGAGLDKPTQAALLRDIAAVRGRSNTAILLLTGDPRSAAALAARTLVLHGGRIVEAGATGAVLSRPAHPFTEALLAARCQPDADRGQRLLPIATGQAALGVGADAGSPGCAFRGPCPAGSSRCAQIPPLGPAIVHDGQAACWNIASPARKIAPPPRWPALPASAAAPVLRLDDVSYRYRTRPPVLGGPVRALALDNITLRLGDREAVAVVGPAGSGKSTLLRIAAGLQTPTAGRRAYPGVDRPQMLFADPLASLPPWRSVGDIVGERLRGGLPRVERATRIEEALGLAQLPPDLAAARPRDLSLAQAQRVALARALIVPPDVLLCDEPLSLLDARAAAGVLNLLAGLRRSLRIALLFATDDIAAARYLADRIVVLRDGRIEEQGPADSVAAAPESETARMLRGLAGLPEAAA